MMERRWYRRSSFFFAATAAFSVFLGALSCSSAEAKIEANLSAEKVTDGGVLIITVKVPADSPAGLVPTAKFETIDIPFFDANAGRNPAQVDPKIYEAILGVPYAHKAGEANVEVSLGTEKQALSFNVIDGNYPSEVLSVSAKHVRPNKKDQERIRREASEVGRIYANSMREKIWDGAFVFPVATPVETSIFGSKRVFNGEMKSFHSGTDYKAPTGTPIHAAAPGVVVLAKNLFFSGNTVLLDHGYGVITLYAHLSKIQVKKGQRVSKLDQLGLSGMTGRVSGPHLHWGAIIHKTKVNPVELTKVMR